MGPGKELIGFGDLVPIFKGRVVLNLPILTSFLVGCKSFEPVVEILPDLHHWDKAKN